MASYYNATSGPLSFQLRDGSSAVVAPKKWIEIPAGQDSSASMVRMLRQGYLVRKDVSDVVAVNQPSSKPLNPPPPAPSKAAPAAKPVVAPEPPKAKAEPVKAEPVKVEPPKSAPSKEPVKATSTDTVPTSSVSAKEVASAGTSTPSKDK